MITITKQVRTETAHRLMNHPGKCKNIHGHSYLWKVTIQGEVDNDGMVTDFGNLKAIMKEEIVNKFDHRLILSQYDSLLNNLILRTNNAFWFFPNDPTAENFVVYVSHKIELALLNCDKQLKLISVKCWETETSYAEWRNESL